MSKLSELDIVKLSEFDASKLTTLLSNSRRVRTILQFNEVAGNKRHATQKQICDEVGVSVATINRTRKELGVSSPYRYSVPTKTETQKEKDKYRRVVNTAFKSGEISELEKSQLYTRINSNLDKSAKDDVSKLKPTVNHSRTTTVVSKTKPLRGGTYKDTADSDDDDRPRGITEEDAQRRIQQQKTNVKTASADTLIQNSLDRLSGKIN